MLLALVLAVKLVDTPFTNDVAGGIHDALTFEMSIDDAIGKLKFVENEAANLAKVFAPPRNSRSTGRLRAGSWKTSRRWGTRISRSRPRTRSSCSSAQTAP